jgi:hypothetical protein
LLIWYHIFIDNIAQEGWGNHFATEALKDALPKGRD